LRLGGWGRARKKELEKDAFYVRVEIFFFHEVFSRVWLIFDDALWREI
jgi:hypothetical protein